MKVKHDNSLSKAVYDDFYRQILSGKLKPGERITETQISESMIISRAPVREALKRLAEEGLVILIPRSGCYVTEPTPSEIDELYEIRQRLEAMALEYGFDNMDKKCLQKLRKQFQDCSNLTHAELLKKEILLDTKLHNLIAEASNLKYLQEILAKMRTRIQVFRVRIARCTEHIAAALQEHIAILDALIAGDREGALTNLIGHIKHTKMNLLGSIDDDGQSSEESNARRAMLIDS